MDRLGSLLPKVLNKRGLGEQANAARICWLANEWLQDKMPTVAELLQAVKFANNELCIESQHAVASQEGQLVSADLLAFLREKCPEIQIDTIRIIREK